MELLQLRSLWSARGAWNHELSSKAFQKISPLLARILRFLFSEKIFLCLLVASLFSSVAMLLHPHFIFLGLMLFSTTLTALRWQGSFNGGSDNMTFLVLMILLLVFCLPSHAALTTILLEYLAFQTSLSFFISGLVKLRNPRWRSGIALKAILESSIYPVPHFLRQMPKSDSVFRAVSNLLIIFELSFPLALFHPDLALIFIFLALGFQLLNVYVLGLNRFFWAWAAAFPSVYFFSQFNPFPFH